MDVVQVGAMTEFIQSVLILVLVIDVASLAHRLKRQAQEIESLTERLDQHHKAICQISDGIPAGHIWSMS